MLRVASEGPRKAAPKVPECSRVLFGLALLLTLLSEGMMNTQYTALSTVITANTDPTALQQLATFAAMEDVAEEEHLDWGSSGRLVQAQRNTIVKPRDAGIPDTTKMAAASPSHSRTASIEAHSDGLSKSISEADSHTIAESSAASSSGSSRRRPHRRHHRRGAAASGDALSDAAAASSTSTDVVSAMAASQPVHSYPMWTQLHVMEVAYSTGENNFVHLTERFVDYQHMFPVVYRCDLARVSCPAEAELLAASRSGLAASSQWACAHCGRKHEAVRESCLRCRAPGPYAKLFVGQAIKEVDCAESLVRFLHATHPAVSLHRVECHHDTHSGGMGRGKGCASVYVAREDAAALQAKLHHNAFFDVDDVTGDTVVYYVYPEQQAWLRSFVQTRSEGGDHRPLFLPLAPLVVEESAATTVTAQQAGRGGRPPGRTQERGNFGVVPGAAVR